MAGDYPLLDRLSAKYQTMLRTLYRLAVVAVLFASTLLAGTDLRALTYGGDRDFPPYEYLNAQGEPAGLNIDLIRAIARREGFRVRIVLRSWPETRKALQDGDVDISAMYRSTQRAREVDFAIPHELLYHEMFVRPGSPVLSSLHDIAGKRVLAQSDTLAADALRELGFGDLLRLLPSEPEALRALVRGEGDLAIVTQTPLRPFAERAEFAGRIRSTGPPVLLTEYAFVTRQGRRNLIEILNQGVAEIKADGEYQEIFDRWLRPDRSASRLRYVTWTAAAILFLALLALAWNQMLRRRVARQNLEIGELDTSFRELADYQAEIDRANRELEAFSYSVSHDLRAPLRAIDGYTRILLEDYAPKLDEEGRRVCGVICDSVNNMGQLIDDLLNFSRLSRAALSPALVDMHALAAAEYRNTGAAAPAFELSPLPPAVGDARLLRQVWVNLISNAVKFSSQREQPMIRVTGQERERDILYTVEDNGAGFDMQYASKLFGVFQRLHSAQEFEGTGVGLAIVQRVVERHGGRVWAESVLGEGATFHFTLPKRRPPETSQNGPA